MISNTQRKTAAVSFPIHGRRRLGMLSTREVVGVRRRRISGPIFVLVVLGVVLGSATVKCEAGFRTSGEREILPVCAGGQDLPRPRIDRKGPVLGDRELRRFRCNGAINSTEFELDPDGISHITWPFLQENWWIADGSDFHFGDDIYADDWNWGSYDDDEGKIALAPAPGWVIFAGRETLDGIYDGYGNQVVVVLVGDERYGVPGFALRYAHLKSIAVEVGDYTHFGSEIGRVGGTGRQDDSFSPHLHSVLYKNIYAVAANGRNGFENLALGYPPGADLSGEATQYAASFSNDAYPLYSDEENLPCTTWNGDIDACNAHSILFGGRYTQDCAYYYCSELCLPRGTSNCRAECDGWCNVWEEEDSDESLPCHTWNGDLEACNEHSILYGDQYTRDCAYYTTNDKCRPRGTSNCLAGIEGYCWE
jgi:hypothetical protein